VITTRETIFALSSGRLPAAIAVVRISGPQAGGALKALIGRLPEPRRGALARIRRPGTDELLDEALALWFPAPRSETGEDVAELQLHGGRAVLAAVLSALGELPGLRPAGPGEFTRRAFLNGQIDLAGVEGLGDLIGAETDAQRRVALRQMKGALSSQVENWRGRLIEALALVEAGIDFADEGDVPEGLAAQAQAVVRPMADQIGRLLAQPAREERLREGLTVAIAGPPNAGKSTLLNALARRDAAIVSDIPGTTRDVIEVHLDLEGYPVALLDTAGIRDTSDPVEREGVRRAEARVADADLVLWLRDATDPHAAALPPAGRAVVWPVTTKSDLEEGDLAERELSGSDFGGEGASAEGHVISARTGSGMDRLVGAIAAYARDYFEPVESGLITRERQRAALSEANAHLLRGLEHGIGAEELVAEDFRLAARALGRVSGRVDVEDVLDSIFRDFCIGK